MCGLTGYFAYQSRISPEVIKILLEDAALRGSDGYGISIASDNIIHHHRTKHLPSDFSEISKDLYSEMKLGDVFLTNFRAVPETEVDVSEENIIETVQPIIDVDNELVLVHNGTVSNFIINDLKEQGCEFNTNIDSEAIIRAYLYFQKDMKETMEYLSGGFAFLLFDGVKKKLYAVCSHGPLYCGYIRGYGMFFHSIENSIYKCFSKIKGFNLEKMNISIWEDYYIRSIPENTITEIDVHSGQVNEQEFIPRYVTPLWDPYLNKYEIVKGHITLVAASGGLDSTTTLATLKMAEMNPRAVHFKYGHRGQEAEEIAIRTITDKLDIPLTIFDIEEHMSMLDMGMLTTPEVEITTGTEQGLKTTAAWTVSRNLFFVTYLTALAESIIMGSNLEKVYITGGFMNLTEEGAYPDNSQRFLKACLKAAKFGTLVGNRIEPLYCLCNLLKTDQLILLKYLNLFNLTKEMISCDRPKVINNIAYNCAKNGIPSCGSGKLNSWGCAAAGVEDLRRYYEIGGEYNGYITPIKQIKEIDIFKIIERISIPAKNKEKLTNVIKYLSSSK